MEEDIKKPSEQAAETDLPEDNLPVIEQEEEDNDPIREALKESEDRYLRMLAEYDNFRKRAKKEHDATYAMAFAQGVATFLPIIDNLDRAVAQECADEEYKKGILLIEKQIQEILGKHSLRAVGEVGETFDPQLHNAVMHIEDEAFGENTICEVFQKGYVLGEKVVRCAVVKVAN